MAWRFANRTPGDIFVSTLPESYSRYDPFKPPASPYFFYGTLQDPGMLRQILGLAGDPVLRPAEMRGYGIRLWGPYPALVRQPDSIVRGYVYDGVTDQDIAQRLQDYETNNYRHLPCYIYANNSSGVEERIEGFTFEFCENKADLVDGEWNLDQWRRRTGRSSQPKTRSR